MPTVNEYWVTNSTHERFFRNPLFRSSLHDWIQKKFAVNVEITLASQPKNYSYKSEISGYRIQCMETNMQQTVFDFISNYLKKIQSRSYENTKDLQWINWLFMEQKPWKFLGKLINKKVSDLYTILTVHEPSLKVSYLPRNPSDDITGDQLESFLRNEILQESILLPISYERSFQLVQELKTEKNDDDVAVIFSSRKMRDKQKQIVIFGYQPKVIEWKKKFLHIIERNTLHTYKFSPIDQSSFEYSKGIYEIEKRYKPFGVNMRLNCNEFSSPEYLKDEIQTLIEQSHAPLPPVITRIFQTIPLFQAIAENEEKHLISLVGNRCNFQIHFKHEPQFYPIPKVSPSNIEISKYIRTQSTLLSSSPVIFKKMNVANGSIELRTGDVAIQEVDTIIISTTSNGLKEGLIDRAQPFDYEKTYLQSDGTMYTETDGGKLKCKRILFSNWTPITLVNSDQILRKSIRSFVTRSFEYAKEVPSIAFAIPDSSIDETILTTEMVTEIKRHLENNQLKQRITLVLLPEQKSLSEQFAHLIETPSTVSAYFDWPMIVMEITLIGPDENMITECQYKITKHLSRCTTSAKLTHSNSIFHAWNQHLINSFYKYCKDQCVLPKFDHTENILELIGPARGIEAVKRKWHMFTELVQHTPIVEHSIHRSGAKLYNIVMSYSPKDTKRCRRLIDRLTEEGFSVGIDLKSNEDKCDCIILCISENYYENSSCVEEAKCAFQTNQPVFLVKTQGHPILGWDYDLFEGKLFFRLFGCEEFFDFEYERLLLQLFRYTKPGYKPILHRRSSLIQQSVNNFREIPKVELNPRGNIEQTSTRIPRQLTFLEERWLYKLENIGKPNLAIFGPPPRFYNHNDEEISIVMPMNSYKISDTCIQLVLPRASNQFRAGHYSPRFHWFDTRPHPSNRQLVIPAVVDDEQICEKIIPANSSTGVAEIFSGENSSEDFIPRQASLGGWWGALSQNGTRNEEEMEQRRKLDNPEEMKDRREQLAQYFLNKYQSHTKDEMKLYSTFAQRMRDNTIAFEKFCSTDTNTH